MSDIQVINVCYILHTVTCATFFHHMYTGSCKITLLTFPCCFSIMVLSPVSSICVRWDLLLAASHCKVRIDGALVGVLFKVRAR